MGDPRLLRQAQPVMQLGTPELDTLIQDMFDTMRAANGAGLAAPQIGEDLQIVIFGFKHNARYPDAPAIPETVLINPVVKPLAEEMEEDIMRQHIDLYVNEYSLNLGESGHTAVKKLIEVYNRLSL